jgi:cytochrome c5
MPKSSTLTRLKSLGFTDSYRIGTGLYKVKCDSCEAMTVNGTPLHERGCPNEVHECKGCNAMVPNGQTYCEDCN